MVMVNYARTYQAFYTKSTPIVDYMVNKLSLKDEDKIFEPCGGDGVFIEAILEENDFADIDICELNPTSIEVLQGKFSNHKNVTIRHCDTLLDNELSFNSNFGGYYDKIIANPPYGAWQDLEKRAILKKMYPNLYAKESYTLFLFRCIELLKEDGILSFIIPDTYLNLHMHKSIRKHILTKTKILELALFPSSFFPGVNFGYANLSIITLQKKYNQSECLKNIFNILSNLSNVEQLNNIQEDEVRICSYSQQDILSNPDFAFLLSDDSNICKAINHSKVKIGDIANCVTGFYSGDDKTFLQVINSDLKNGKNYDLIDTNKINTEFKNMPNILDGIEDDKCFLPIVKGGNTKYLKPDSWFMNWSKESVSHYKKGKKARFQNPQYYFKYGIGVPMISSSSITASLIENKLFDQSIVGIFPKDENLTYYLLAFFNSATCNKLIRTINPSANNPANYIKKIPFIHPNYSQLIDVNNLVKSILTDIITQGYYDTGIEIELNKIIEQIYGF
jgi:adenine-specific DNA-methyltransferase